MIAHPIALSTNRQGRAQIRSFCTSAADSQCSWSGILLAALVFTLAPRELPAQQGADQPAAKTVMPTLPNPRSVAAQLVKALVVRAQQCEDRQEFAEAVKFREQVLTFKTTLLGKEDWEVTDARLTLDHTRFLEKLTPQQRQQFQRAASLLTQATDLSAKGKHKEAAAAAEEAVGTHRQVVGDEHPLTAGGYDAVGACYASQGDFAKALPAHEKALSIRMKVLGADHPDTVISCLSLATTFTALGKQTLALPLYERALDVRNRTIAGVRVTGLFTKDDMAAAYENAPDWKTVLPVYEHVLSAWISPEYPDKLRRFRQNMKLLQADATPQYYALPISIRIPVYQAIVEARRKARGNEHPSTLRSMENLAVAYYRLGSYGQALPLFQEGLSTRRKILGDTHADTAHAFNDLAVVYKVTGDYAQALPLQRRAVEIWQKVRGEQHSDTAVGMDNLAQIYHARRDYQAAQDWYQKALRIKEKVHGESHPETARTASNLAELYRAMGQYEQAKPLLERALRIYRQAYGENHPQTASALDILGGLSHSLGEFDKATQYCQQALEIDRKVKGEDHPETLGRIRNLGIIHWSMGDHAKALEDYEKVLDDMQRQWETTSIALSERQQMEAIKLHRARLDAFLSLAQQHGLSAAERYRLVLTGKGAVFLQQSRTRQLAADPKLAALFQEFQAVSVQLATLALASSKGEARHDRAKRIEDLTTRKEQLEAELSRGGAALRQAGERLSPEKLQASLPADAALVDILEYQYSEPDKQARHRWNCEQRLAAFVVRRGSPIEWVELGAAAAVESVVDDWRRRMQAKRFEDVKTAAKLRAFWEKLDPHLQGAKIVLISPDGPLNRFSWGALPGKERGTYLLEERVMAIVPVPQLLPYLLAELASPGKPRPKESLLLVGDVDYGQAPGKSADLLASRSAPASGGEGKLFNFPSLEHTREEIATIEDSFRKAFTAGKVKKLHRQQATESAFRREVANHRYLHLATHGFFSPESVKSVLQPSNEDMARSGLLGREGIVGWHPGLLSGLALTGANVAAKDGEDDGILTATEVASLDLRNTELAVMSACETGLGRVAGGEGILGLQRAFQVSGARTTVASLWAIDDLATQQLMVKFYDNRWNKKLSKLEALRQAQLWMLQHGAQQGGPARGLVRITDDQPKTDRAPPFFWAAFVLSGDWR